MRIGSTMFVKDNVRYFLLGSRFYGYGWCVCWCKSNRGEWARLGNSNGNASRKSRCTGGRRPCRDRRYKTYKGNRRRCRNPDRDPFEPSRAMPANEDTSANDFALARIKPERANPSAGSQSKMSRKDDSSANLILSNFTASTEERKETEKGDFRSIPCRSIHEKLFRDFFELVLQRAVFQVNLFIFVRTIN